VVRRGVERGVPIWKDGGKRIHVLHEGVCRVVGDSRLFCFRTDVLIAVTSRVNGGSTKGVELLSCTKDGR
jgi:hypothetical protein